MKPTIEFRFVLVTPELAHKWLKNDTRNRSISHGQVVKISSEIKDGRFVVTHQTIAITRSGKVKDGQHRLHGVIESGIATWMWVAIYLDDDQAEAAMAVIDRGRKRDLGDSVEISGLVNNLGKSRVATANVMYDLEHGTGGNVHASDGQMVNIVVGSIDRFDRIRQVVPMKWTAPAVGAFVWALQYDDRVVELARRLAQATEISDISGSEIALRDLVNTCVPGGRGERLAYSVKILRGIEAWLNGEKLVKIMPVDRNALIGRFRKMDRKRPTQEEFAA